MSVTAFCFVAALVALSIRACTELPELKWVFLGLAALGVLVLFTTGGHVAFLEFR